MLTSLPVCFELYVTAGAVGVKRVLTVSPLSRRSPTTGGVDPYLDHEV